MKTIKIGIIGYGTVGQATAELLSANQKLIEERCGVHFTVAAVCRRSSLAPEMVPAGARRCADWREVTSASDIDVVVETMGGNGTAHEVVRHALLAGKPVVTANKSLIANHGDEIFSLAFSKSLPIGIEATTAGGIPIVRALRESAAGDRILRIYGILNGTANYILSRMESEGLDFDVALREAQGAGYAEADPTLDIDGFDAREKLCILTRLAFDIGVHPEQIPTAGIRKVSQVDLQYARKLGGRIRLVAAAERFENGISMSVRPWLVPHDSMLGKVEGVFNAIFVEGERSGMQMFYGRGAGGVATSTAVVSDLIDIAQKLVANGASTRSQIRGFGSHSVLPLGAGDPCEWYLRLQVRDRPGILARVAHELAEDEINIDSVLQEPYLAKDPVSFVITVDRVSEQVIQRSISRINKSEFLCEPVLLVRMIGK